MRSTVRSCPACGGDRAVDVHRLALRTPDGHPLADGYDVVSCIRCGTGFADVDVPQRYYDEYYARVAKYAAEAATDAVRAAEPRWKAARLDDAADRIAALVGDRRARILDIGCANGTLLGALRRRGFTAVRGVDPSPGSAAIALAHHGVRVDVGTFSQLPAGLGTFDCICLTGVLEHLLDVDTAMAHVRARLRPGGLVYLDLPDASRYADPYIAPFEDFSTEHVNHFSPHTLDVLAARFGFNPVFTERFMTELVAGVPYAAIRTAWRTGLPAMPVTRDEELCSALAMFTKRSQHDLSGIDSALRTALGDHGDYAVWGVGELTMKLLALPILTERRLVALVDGNTARHGLSFGAVTVRDPATLPGDAPVIIGSLLSADAIARSVGAAALPNPIINLRRALVA